MDTQPSDQAVRRRRARRAFIVLGALSVLAIGAYLFYGWWTRGEVSTDNAQVDADVVPVAPRVAGVVASVSVVDHQHVAAGDVLMSLDPTDLELEVRKATADLEAATAQAAASDAQVEVVRAASQGGHSTARAGVDESNAAVRTATAQVDAARAAVARAESDEQRKARDLADDEKLAATGAITATQLEATRTAHQAAVATLDQAKAQAAAAREQRGLAQARVGEARGKLEQTGPVDAQIRAATAAAELAHARADAAQVALDLARQSLGYTRIVAPIAGTVSRLGVHAGQTVQLGQPVVIVVPAETYVVANLKETEIARVHTGQKVDIELDAYPDRTFHGRIAAISAATGARFSLLPPDNATGNFVKVVQRVPVKIAWTELPASIELRPGMSADVVIHVGN
ncbi:MAG TPA: HlyD family secretion protein [Kofleriaceae bacterium]|nr:HlyD family secretion protein [Kofleriaceae bacterium]